MERTATYARHTMDVTGGGASHKFGEPLQILCDCCQRELELRAARSSQA